MPGLISHCNSCRKKYDYDFKQIHQWMDEPAIIAAGQHRKVRHDWYRTPREAEKIFWNKVPEEYRILIKDAVLDHIILDRDSPTSSNNENKIISISIPKMQYDWLEKHKHINRSEIFQDIVNKAMKYDATTKKEINEVDEKHMLIEEIIKYLETNGYIRKTEKIDDNRNSMFL